MTTLPNTIPLRQQMLDGIDDRHQVTVTPISLAHASNSNKPQQWPRRSFLGSVHDNVACAACFWSRSSA